MTDPAGQHAALRVLVTGSAGFIGFHVARALLARGYQVLGLDVVNDYYDVRLKEARLSLLARQTDYRHARANLADEDALTAAFAGFGPERVVHLAAQAGVRYSLTNPGAYVRSNRVGFTHVLEAWCRQGDVEHPRSRSCG